MNRRRVPVIVSAALLCLMPACEENKPPESSPAQSAQPVLPIPSASVAKPRRHHRSGFERRARGWWNDPATMLIHRALQDETLTDEQQTKLEALRGPMGAGRVMVPASIGTFRTALADAVQAGKIDEKVFETQFAEMEKAGEEMRAQRAKRLNDLHAILTPEQRKTIADEMRKRLNEGPLGMAGGMAPPGGSGSPPRAGHAPHPGGPRHSGPMPPPGASGGPASRGPMAGRMREHRFGGPMGWLMMTRGLDLTEAQQKKIEALAKTGEKKEPNAERREAMREAFKKNMLELIDAFEKDTFDATTLAIFKAPPKPDLDPMKAHLKQFEAFIAILTPEQREKVAERLSKPDEGWRRMDPGGPRPGYWDAVPDEETTP